MSKQADDAPPPPLSPRDILLMHAVQGASSMIEWGKFAGASESLFRKSLLNCICFFKHGSTNWTEIGFCLNFMCKSNCNNLISLDKLSEQTLRERAILVHRHPLILAMLDAIVLHSSCALLPLLFHVEHFGQQSSLGVVG